MRRAPTFCFYVTDEISASLSFKVFQKSILGEIIK